MRTEEETKKEIDELFADAARTALLIIADRLNKGEYDLQIVNMILRGILGYEGQIDVLDRRNLNLR